jgi:multidrug transporter EmrE-like cation transporter
VVSPLRRCAVLITFFGGIIAYREKNMRPKLICILIILMGIFVLKWSS